MSKHRLEQGARPLGVSSRPGVLARAATAIHGCFAIELDPFVLGLFRVALGAYVLLFYVMLAPSWTFYYGVEGITPHARADVTGYLPLLPILWFVESDAVLWALYAVSVASAILFALGVLWRVSGFWLWHMNLALLFGNSYVVNGEEQVMSLLLLFALFLPLGSSLTLRQLCDPAQRRAMSRGDAVPRVKVWAFRALQVHLMLVYLLSVPDKLSDVAWRDGTLVYYAMMATDYPRWPGLEIFAWGNAIVSRVLTWFAVAVEVLVPFLIWFRRLRVPCVLAAMALHVGMGLLLEGVMMFNGAMLVGMLLFLPSGRTRVWIARLLTGRPSAPLPMP
jgi:hypothetical protein